jgi:hypothetical protein
MTAPVFTEHADVLFDADKPILGSTHLEARDNLQSVAGGGVDAPRIALMALERLVAGDSIRSRVEGFDLAAAAIEFFTIHKWTFIQHGTITAQINRTVGVSQQMRIVRTRNGVDTVVTAATATNIDDDIAVIPGDTIKIQGENTTGSVTTYSAYFLVAAGVSLYPDIPECLLEGNPTP